MKSNRQSTQPRTRLVACYRALLIIGTLLLGYCFITVLQKAVFQTWAYRQMLGARAGSPTGLSLNNAQALSLVGHPRGGQNRLTDMTVVGRLEIPSIHASAMVAEGDSARVLERAVGHVPGTALPGEDGNVVLAGHRDTFFRGLGHLGKNDLITLETVQGSYLYRVKSTRVVDSSDTWVLEPSRRQILTLVTCYPFHFIGPAPRRFIVRATLLDSDSHAAHLGGHWPTDPVFGLGAVWLRCRHLFPSCVSEILHPVPTETTGCTEQKGNRPILNLPKGAPCLPGVPAS